MQSQRAQATEEAGVLDLAATVHHHFEARLERARPARGLRPALSRHPRPPRRWLLPRWLARRTTRAEDRHPEVIHSWCKALLLKCSPQPTSDRLNSASKRSANGPGGVAEAYR